MRIPFDLIAAFLGLEAVREAMAERFAKLGMDEAQALAYDRQYTSTSDAVLALVCFWLVVWLLHEVLARRMEWRTRWGRFPGGWPEPSDAESRPRLHPREVYARWTILLQAVSVGLYVLFLWHYSWPLKTSAWPQWLGLDRILQPSVVQRLGNGLFVGGLLDLCPFAVAMVLSWIPKRRLSGGWSGNLGGWLSFEARLTFPPLVLWLLLYLVLDMLDWTVGRSQLAHWTREPWVAVLVGLGSLVFFALFLMPWLVVRMWQCRPLPAGELRTRLESLLGRSGVRARAIMAWGPRGSGFANACVLGPLAPFRYILVSPGLTDFLSLEECEAVVAHEIGHARHGHLVLLVSLLLTLTALGDLALQGLNVLGLKDPFLSGAVFMVLVALYLRVVFGAVMRRCEAEADLTAAELVGSPLPVISALEKVSEMSGGIRRVYSWHHGSIAQRVERLADEGIRPEAIQACHARQRRLRRVLAGLAAAAVAALLGVATVRARGEGRAEETPGAVEAPAGLERP